MMRARGGKKAEDLGDSVKRHKCDRGILLATLVLMAIGLIVIYALSPLRANVLNSAYGKHYDANYFFFGQLRSVGLALVAFLVAFLVVPYRVVGRLAKFLMLLALALLVFLWVLSLTGSSMAVCELGACRWLAVSGGMSFQPAEFAKLALVLYFANLIARKKEEGTMGLWSEFWVPILVVLVVVVFFVVGVQKDLGTGLVIMAILMAMLLASGVKMWQYVTFLTISLMIGVLSVVLFPHRMERLATFLGNGDKDASYHVDNAMLAIGTGGMFGVGIGSSVQATGYLPESINDSVFAIMGETFGFFGLFIIVTIFATIMFRMLAVAERTAGMEQRLAVVGVFAWFFTHVVVNIAAMTGLVPVTGITLPLMSYGGTSMIFLAFSIGLVLRISCYTSREVKHENTSSGRGVRGTRHSSSGGGA